MEIYGVTGKKRHGKDTFAKCIVSFNTNFKIIHFADKLRSMLQEIFPVTENQLTDQSLKEKAFDHPIDMDSYLSKMRQVTNLDIKPMGKIATSPRESMQFFGADYVRNVQEDYWIQKVLDEIKSPDDQVIIPDTRFLNEANVLRSLGGKIVKIQRLDLPDSKDNHLSETEMEQIVPDLHFGTSNNDTWIAESVAKLLAFDHFDLALKYNYSLFDITELRKICNYYDSFGNNWA